MLSAAQACPADSAFTCYSGLITPGGAASGSSAQAVAAEDAGCMVNAELKQLQARLGPADAVLHSEC